MKGKKLAFVIAALAAVLITAAIGFLWKGRVRGESAALESWTRFQSDIEAGSATTKSVLDRHMVALKSAQDSPPVHALEKHYTIDSLGVFANHSKSLLSNAYINKGVEVDEDLKRFLAQTDHLESTWDEIHKSQSGSLKWQYAYHLKSNTIRLYPWLDFSKHFGSSTEWSLVRYFRTYERVRPFLGTSFCTRPYDDEGGIGLSLSCCKVFDPTGRYENVVLTCHDFGFQKSIADLRSKLSGTGACHLRLTMISSAPEFAYEPEVIVDLDTGGVKKGRGIVDNDPGAADELFVNAFFGITFRLEGCRE